MSDDPSLSKAYDLKTPEDSVRLYRDWAESYEDDFVAENGYELHAHVARIFQAQGGRGPVLDIGAGTGICGAALAQAGIGPIDAMDISAEMLAQAKTKGVYGALIEADILAGLPIDTGRYAGVVSSGTFTHGHVGPEALHEVLRIMAPGGLAVLSVNAEHFEAEGFGATFEAMSPQLRRLDFEEVRIYAETAQFDHADDLGRIAIFEKA